MDKLIVVDLCGKNCLTEDLGNKVFDAIKKNLEKNKKIIVDFSDVSTYSSSFCNNSLSKLHRDYSTDFLNDHVYVIGLNSVGHRWFSLCNDHAKEFYKEKHYG